jgi:indole-3-glycerol phosphate synthase
MTRQELERALKLDGRLIGINNRNLRTFETKLETTEELAPKIPRDRNHRRRKRLLHARHDLARLARINVNTFLIGESLMRQTERRSRDPGAPDPIPYTSERLT